MGIVDHSPDIVPSGFSGWSTDDADEGEIFRGELYLKPTVGSPATVSAEATWDPVYLTDGFSVEFAYRVDSMARLKVVVLGDDDADTITIQLTNDGVGIYDSGTIVAFTRWRPGPPKLVGHVVLHVGNSLTFLDVSGVSYIRAGAGLFPGYSFHVSGISLSLLEQPTRFDLISVYRDFREVPGSVAPSPRIAWYPTINSNAGTPDPETGLGTGDTSTFSTIYAGLVSYPGGVVQWYLEWEPDADPGPPPTINTEGATWVSIDLNPLANPFKTNGTLRVYASVEGVSTNIIQIVMADGISSSDIEWGPVT